MDSVDWELYRSGWDKLIPFLPLFVEELGVHKLSSVSSGYEKPPNSAVFIFDKNRLFLPYFPDPDLRFTQPHAEFRINDKKHQSDRIYETLN